jgi:hypothetical protein
MRIRALTTPIYPLQPQGIPSESLISAIPYHSTFPRIQGSSGVTGNTDRSAICTVNIHEIEDSLHIAFRENADHGPSRKTFVKVQKIELSTTSLHNLADPP